jgi:hypothetical protein
LEVLHEAAMSTRGTAHGFDSVDMGCNMTSASSFTQRKSTVIGHLYCTPCAAAKQQYIIDGLSDSRLSS